MPRSHLHRPPRKRHLPRTQYIRGHSGSSSVLPFSLFQGYALLTGTVAHVRYDMFMAVYRESTKPHEHIRPEPHLITTRTLRSQKVSFTIIIVLKVDKLT